MPELNNVKAKQIVTKARSLFWKFGMKRVSIEEICREANVSKMTFYKYFKNKIELVKFILDQIEAESTEKYKQIMNQDLPFIEKVRETINLKMEQTEQLSQEFYADLHQNADPKIHDYFIQMTQRGIKLIMDDYTKAQINGDIRKDLKIEFIIYFLNKFFAMADDPNLIKMYDSPQAIIMELTNFFFYGILPRKMK